MEFLIIGLGSMGKRRIRCLKKLGYNGMLGYDLRDDRRTEAEEKYNVKTIGYLDNTVLSKTGAIIISTPPDKHNEYIRLAIENKKPAFVEASVILEGLETLNNLAKNQSVFIAPSCTMRFHPAIRDIKNIVNSRKYGKVTNLTYHAGQYLPDWHPWEDVKDYYVSQKKTNACREIIPFELTWITDIVGFPVNISGFHGKTMDIGTDTDDTYVISMDFGDHYGSMTIDAVSRYATRSLILNMEYGQILWRWDENFVNLYDVKNMEWTQYHSTEGQAAEGYNKNIIEEMYIDELAAFIDAVNGENEYPNSLGEDIKTLKLLYKMEGKYNNHPHIR